MIQSNRREVLQLLGGAVALPLAAGVVRGGATKPRIKVGQIGVGHAHANKLQVFRESPDYEVVGIVEADESLRREAQTNETYQDLPWMTQEQLLNVPGLELVLVETRVRDLLDAAEASVAAGKHIHLDKPAGSSLPQFRRILEAAERQQLLVQMGYMYRYSPAIVMLRDFLQRGWLGEPFEVHAVMSKQVGMEKRASWNEQPGGTMFELGCHLVDLVVGVMGKPDQVTAYPRRTIAGDGLQDNMLAVFEYPKATATIKSTALEVEGFDRRHLVVCGTEGTFHIQPLDRPQARLALSQERGKYQKDYQDVTFPKYSRYVDDAADIARVIRGEKSSEFSYAHDLTVQTAVLEASAMSTD